MSGGGGESYVGGEGRLEVVPKGSRLRRWHFSVRQMRKSVSAASTEERRALLCEEQRHRADMRLQLFVILYILHAFVFLL